MSQRGRRLAFDAIRVRHPNADDMEIRLRFMEIAYGGRRGNGTMSPGLWLCMARRFEIRPLNRHKCRALSLELRHVI